jgi:hypothetical protein
MVKGWLRRAYEILTAEPNQHILDCILKAEDAGDMRTRFAALPDGELAHFRRDPSRLLKAALKTDNPDILDAVVEDFAQGDHNITIFESATLLPPGSVMCISAFDLLHHAQIAHARKIVDHMLALPDINISRRHLHAAQVHGTRDQIDFIRSSLQRPAKADCVM